jgi:hypothetical protein
VLAHSYNYIFFEQVEPFDEVMIKQEPFDEVSSDSNCLLPEASVKHEMDDPIAV